MITSTIPDFSTHGVEFVGQLTNRNELDRLQPRHVFLRLRIKHRVLDEAVDEGPHVVFHLFLRGVNVTFVLLLDLLGELLRHRV